MKTTGSESVCSEPNPLRTRLKAYTKEKLLAHIRAAAGDDAGDTEVFGDRIALSTGGKRFEAELRDQVILLRDTTDQYLIDQEVGKLYRHEMTAALMLWPRGSPVFRG